MQRVRFLEKNANVADTEYRIVEIFETLQGEGFNTGMPSIFIRFGKCNLACPWCDTNYNDYETKTLAEIMQTVRRFTARNIIITGGEPTIQPNLERLLDQLKAEGYFIAIETNGFKAVPLQIDYIATSPKRLYQKNYLKHHIPFAHEVRIVVDDDVFAFCEQIEQSIKAERYYLSPCERNGEMNMLETIRLLGLLNQRPNRPRWQLSIQTHKMAGIE
ncbi:radical SAM protein [[Haemophilus] felis]|nr:radical SAM protein [[Haemophilus] felis]